MLFSARQRRDEVRRREAAGEDLWTTKISDRARTQLSEIWRAWEDVVFSNNYGLPQFRANVLRILKLEGGWNVGQVSPDQLESNVDEPYIIDLLGAFLAAMRKVGYGEDIYEMLDVRINEVFYQHRIGYRVVDGEVLSVKTDELQTEVVEPALRLLISNRFDAAQVAYLKAIKEVSAGHPDDAITDAGTALAEVLKALGCSGTRGCCTIR